MSNKKVHTSKLVQKTSQQMALRALAQLGSSDLNTSYAVLIILRMLASRSTAMHSLKLERRRGKNCQNNGGIGDGERVNMVESRKGGVQCFHGVFSKWF